MGTYNLTKGDTRVSAMDYGKLFVARIPIVVTEIIAANATLTANAKITAADVIQIWDVPADAILLPQLGSFMVVSPGTASNTADIGIGSKTDYMLDGVALDAAAGTITLVAVSQEWGADNLTSVDFESTDTIDMIFVADEVTGSFLLMIPGYMCE